MPRRRVLRAALATAVVLAGIGGDARGLVEEGGALASRLGHHVPGPPAQSLEPTMASLGATLTAAARPEPFLGAPPGDPRDGEPSASDDAAAPVAPDEPVVAEPTEPAEPEGGPVLVSIGRETWVLAEPRWEAKKLGYLRAGAVVPRAAKIATRRDCRGGWYRIEPEGFVCAGARATVDREHPAARLSQRRPDTTGLPYLYALTRYPTPPLYARMPTEEQQRSVEGDLESHLRNARAAATKPEYVAPPEPEPLPPELADGRLLPSVNGEARGPEQLVLGHAKKRSGWAMLGTYESGGRRFGLTTELALVPLDRTRVVRPSSFRGVELSDEYGLPLAVTRARSTKRYQLDSAGGLSALAPFGSREAVPLTGREHRAREGLLLETRDGTWVRADQVTPIERYRELPRFARRGVKWLDVSLLRQTLVAYEGARPVYATLVSSGKDGVKDHKDSHATIQGTFLVHTKHLSVTMDSDDEEDEFDLRDVPYVQYFKEGYALHAAYWHDDFGTPRSHGCVNLAPLDAAWLFGWTTPGVPEGWHAAMSLKAGTIVHIHP
ncbi:MAG: L,D-transpeptidase family protein [Deltaproteobacteria bacterium]|nr:L,D-transpeptidase family protein [Deltaproteobacteria bacterium]